jgi:hypothetical protein
MTTSADTKLPPLQEGLLQALQAIDKQIARELNTRTPAEREQMGLKKWEAFESRVESLTVFLLDEFGAETINLDSLLVLSQALVKALSLTARDLENEGLGVLRSEYCVDAFEKLLIDIERAKAELKGSDILC